MTLRHGLSRGVFLPLLDLDRLDEQRRMWPLWQALRLWRRGVPVVPRPRAVSGGRAPEA